MINLDTVENVVGVSAVLFVFLRSFRTFLIMRSKEISKENLQYINQFYQLSVTIGQRVVAIGKPGTVVGARNGYLLVQLDSNKAKNPGNYHPTYDLVYLDQILTWVA